MRKIVIIANFMKLSWEGGNSRFIYILNELCKNDVDVELITSSFIHSEKKQREFDNTKCKDLPYKISLIYEPGYKKNVSLMRFYSHYIFAKNVLKYIKKISKPDIIYCAVPSLDVACAVSKYAKKNNIRFIIDIQDLWPEAFKMVFNVPVISNMIYYPMKKKADTIYSNADDIVAVSNTYLNRALENNTKANHKLSVFLGTDLNYFDLCKKENQLSYNDEIIRIAYIGTLGHSYNIKCIIDAIELLNKKGNKKILFVVMGNGPLEEDFKSYAIKKNVECEFTGRLEYPKMVGKLCSCDIAVNPIASNAAQSIINKVGDYAAAGLPVISTQECKEYVDLINTYEIGYNVRNDDINQIANKIEELCNNEDKRNLFGKNNRRLAEEKFDRRKTYLEIKNMLYNE